MKDRLRERAQQIDMAKNGFSLPWAKKHLSPLLYESADRMEALEGLVKSLYAAYHDEWPDRAEEEYAERMRELGVM